MEKPNLSQIKEISGEDIDFQNSILEIIRIEFPEEVAVFKQNFKGENYLEASINIHKIKHKISLLGLEKGLDTASRFEIELKGKFRAVQSFLEILDKIHVYLYK